MYNDHNHQVGSKQAEIKLNFYGNFKKPLIKKAILLIISYVMTAGIGASLCQTWTDMDIEAVRTDRCKG